MFFNNFWFFLCTKLRQLKKIKEMFIFFLQFQFSNTMFIKQLIDWFLANSRICNLLPLRLYFAKNLSSFYMHCNIFNMTSNIKWMIQYGNCCWDFFLLFFHFLSSFFTFLFFFPFAHLSFFFLFLLIYLLSILLRLFLIHLFYSSFSFLLLPFIFFHPFIHILPILFTV